jgi:hypothetical protein
VGGNVKKASTLDILFKGVSSTSGTGKVSASEQTRIRRERKKRGYFAQAREKNILEALRRSTDIIHDWPPNVSWWKKVAACLIPPPQMTVDEWSDRYRLIAPEFAGRSPGSGPRVACPISALSCRPARLRIPASVSSWLSRRNAVEAKPRF